MRILTSHDALGNTDEKTGFRLEQFCNDPLVMDLQVRTHGRRLPG